MAVDVGELIASISFDTSEMLKGIDRANNYLSKFSGKFTEVTKAIDNQTSVMEGSFRELGNSIGITYEKVVQSNDKLIRANEKTAKSFSDMTASFRAVRNDIQGLGDSLQKGLAAVGRGAATQAKAFAESAQIMERGVNRMSAAGEKMSGALSTNTRTVTNAVTGMGQNVKSSVDNVAKSVEMFGIRSSNALANFQLRVQESQATTIGALRGIDTAFQALATAIARSNVSIERSTAALLNALRNTRNFAKQFRTDMMSIRDSLNSMSKGASLGSIVSELQRVQREIARTNDLLRNSTISVRGFGDAGLAATNAVNKGFESTNRFTDGFMGKIRMVVMDLFFLQMAALQSFGILTTVFGQGIKFASEMETTIIGMAAVMSSSLNLDGEALPFAKAMEISKDVVEDLKIEALRTTATLEELMTVYQAILGPAVQLGMSLKQVKDFTVIGANAVKSLGLNHQQLVQELRSIVAGNITTRGSTLATALGITNDDIKKAKESAEGVFGFLEKRMEGFKAAVNETAGTLSAMWSNIQDGIQQTQEAGFGKLFKYVKDEVKILQEIFFQFERYTQDVFDKEGKKLFSAGDINIETFRLNKTTVTAFATLAKITSQIYYDIKNFVMTLLSSEEFVNKLYSILYSVSGVIQSIYQNISSIISMVGVWFIATGSVRTIMMALVAASGNIERVMYFIQNNIYTVIALMFSWRILASQVHLAFTFISGATVTTATAMATIGRGLGGVIGLLAAAIAYHHGINFILEFIKENVFQIATAILGWQVAMAVVTTSFGGIGAAVVLALTAVAILSQTFNGFASAVGTLIQVVSTLAITFGILNGFIGLFSISMVTATVSTYAATAAKAALNAVVIAGGTVMAVYTGIVFALNFAMGVLGITVTLLWGKIILITAAILAVVAVIGTLIGAWNISGGVMNWIKDKWNTLTSRIWVNNDALKENIRLQRESAELQGARSYLEAMGYDERDIAEFDRQGITKDVYKNHQKQQRDKVQGLLTPKYADGDGSGGADGAKKENRIQEAIGKYNEAVIDAERKLAVEGYKNALKDLEEQFKDNRIGIGQYYSEQLRLNTLIKQAELDALKEKKAEEEKLEAIARGLGEEAKAINHATNAVKIEADIKTKLIEIDRLKTQSTIDQTKAYKDLDKEVNKINLEFAKSHGGLTEEQKKAEIADKYGDKLKYLAANYSYLEDKKKRDGQLSVEETKRYNELSLAIRNTRIDMQELGYELDLNEIKRKQNNISSKADIAKSQVENQLKTFQISEWDAKQRIYDIENQEAKELQATIVELENKLKDMKGTLMEGGEEWNKYSKQLSDTKSKVVALTHPLSAIQEAIAVQFKNSLEDAFVSIVTGTKSVSDAFRDMGRQILATAARILANKFVTSLLGGLFGGGSIAPSIIGKEAGGIFRSEGGPVYGPGTTTSDSVPAMLSNGEYVLRAEAVRRIGLNTLNALNQYGTLPPLKFASGGYVAAGKSGGYQAPNANQAPNIKIEVHNETGVQANAEMMDMKFDGEQWVMGLWLKGVAKNTMGSRDFLKGATR